MSGISPVSAASIAPSHLRALSGGKAAQASGLGSRGAGPSGDTTTTTSNANGSLTTTTINAQGQIVSSSTTQLTNQAVLASNFATQANLDTLQGQLPSSLLNMLV